MNTLPYEILVYMFKYLPKSDRLAASEVCRSWYSAANDKCFLEKKVALFHKTSLNTEISPLKTLHDSVFNYCNYVFSNLELSSDLNYFWQYVGPVIKSLTIKNCDISEKVFNFIVSNCTNLEYINIEDCKDLFMSGCLLEGEHGKSLQNLKGLSLSGNQYLTDALLRRFIMCTNDLKHLDLSNCPLQCHFALVRKFYPNTTELISNPSESVLTFYYVLCWLKLKAKYIKNLSFSNTLFDGSALDSLCKLDDLQLERLDVSMCDQLTSSGLLALSTYQTTLKELHIDMCSRVTDVPLIHICDKLINLEVLQIQGCSAITDLGIQKLHQLKKLKTLNISQCEMLTKDGIQSGLCNEINYNLLHLDVHCLYLNEDAIVMICERLPNLESLNISNCFNAVTDYTIQDILKNLTNLHSLNLAFCPKVSDAGLTGIGAYADIDLGDPSSSNFHHRIPLGSRAEEEIVQDAKRKHDVMKMCEAITIDTNLGYSISRLKNLQLLDLTRCNRVTDVSLTYAFKLKELSDLKLTHCQQITEKGMKGLVQNCPSIEFLDLKDCYNLNDDAITMTVQGLPRLRDLNLMGCNQLTDKTLAAVETFCKTLRYLNVQRCRKITPELASKLTSPWTLHTVLTSKPEVYENDFKKKVPSAPFFPNIFKKLRLN